MRGVLSGFRTDLVLELLAVAVFYRDYLSYGVFWDSVQKLMSANFLFEGESQTMKKLAFLVLTVLCFSVATVASDDDVNTFRARLRGLNETPGPVATQATGSFHAMLSADGTTLDYTVTYSNLNAQVLFSHIHFGFPKESGGIMVFLCGPAAGATGGPPAGFPNPPACPDTTSGTVTGSVTAANVIGPNSEGITPGKDL